MFSIFLTGATGYIGGDILYELTQAHPNWNITALVRTEEAAARVKDSYPKISTVIGDNDSAELLENEAAKADAVIHAAASDECAPAAEAITRGLNRSGYGTYLHTSGGLGWAGESLRTNRYGVALNDDFSDWGDDNINKIWSRSDTAPHIHVDKIVMRVASDTIKTAIIAPAVVYGVGRGPIKHTMFPLYEGYLKQGQFFTINEGNNAWNDIHVADLSKLYRLLVESGLANDGRASWGRDGFYIGENGMHVVKDIIAMASSIAFAKGYITHKGVVQVTPEQADSRVPYSRYVIGTDSRGFGVRGKKLLGWNPTLTYAESLPQILDDAQKCTTRSMPVSPGGHRETPTASVASKSPPKTVSVKVPITVIAEEEDEYGDGANRKENIIAVAQLQATFFDVDCVWLHMFPYKELPGGGGMPVTATPCGATSSSVFGSLAVTLPIVQSTVTTGRVATCSSVLHSLSGGHGEAENGDDDDSPQAIFAKGLAERLVKRLNSNVSSNSSASVTSSSPLVVYVSCGFVGQLGNDLIGAAGVTNAATRDTEAFGRCIFKASCALIEDYRRRMTKRINE